MSNNIKSIILGVTGSIAAYKSIELAKLLKEQEYEVDIVLTRSASDFVSPLMLRSLFPNNVYCTEDVLDDNDEMLHITLAKKADYVLIAPCSANFMAKLAQGIADDLLSTLCLATHAPIIIAPAMNKVMWENHFVQKNYETLRCGNITIIGPENGLQACGDVGVGRMLKGNKIVDFMEYMAMPKILVGKRMVITAGPTHEPYDPVRFMGNYSSGKMGYALAKAARKKGAEVILISGPTHLPLPENITCISIETAKEMQHAVEAHIQNAHIFIGAAAVADYSPHVVETQKIKKKEEVHILELIRNEDIIASMKQKYPHVFYIGFAAETENHEEHGLSKLKKKNLDMIIVNDVSKGKVFGKDENEGIIFLKNGEKHFIENMTKEKMACRILNVMLNHSEKT